jgi:heme exporter protein B
MNALLLRDMRLAMRAGGGFGLSLAFFLIVVVLVPFGVGPEMGLLSKIAPGILWVGALLACLLSLDRIFALDFEDGTLDLLATAPLPLEAVVSVKSFAHWITTGLPLVLAAPVLGVLLGLQSDAFYWIVCPCCWAHPRSASLDIWCGADGGVKRGRIAFVAFGLAAIRSHADIWRRTRATGDRGDGCGDPHVTVIGHHICLNRAVAICISCGFKD